MQANDAIPGTSRPLDYALVPPAEFRDPDALRLAGAATACGLLVWWMCAIWMLGSHNVNLLAEPRFLVVVSLLAAIGSASMVGSLLTKPTWRLTWVAGLFLAAFWLLIASLLVHAFVEAVRGVNWLMLL